MKKFIDKYNLVFFIPLVFLMIASLFCMYQARFIKDIYLGHFAKQILWFGIGFFLLFFLRYIKSQFLFSYSFYFYLLGNLLLLLVLFLGKDINGAKAWFDFKFFHFQPSEFMKIALLLYLSKLLKEFCRQKEKKEGKFILKCTIVTLIPSLLVFLEPDTGAILFYGLLLLSTFVMAKIKKRWFLLAFLFILLFGGTFLYLYFYQQDFFIQLFGTSFFYRMDRLIHFQDKSSLQLENALTTIGNAGVFGHGIKKEILYVPEFPTDFVFSLSLSIFGFLGGILLLLCFLILNLFFVHCFIKTKTIEYKAFLHGFLYLFLFQQIENILMNLGFLPIMGIPLPFLSYGGSNMIVYFLCIGLILNMKKS